MPHIAPHHPHSSKRLNIAMVVNNFPTLSQTFIALQIAELAKQGHNITVVALGKLGPEEWLPFDNKKLPNPVKVINSKPPNKKRNLFRRAFLVAKYPGKTIHLMRAAARTNNFSKLAILIDNLELISCIPHQDIIHCQFANLATNIVLFKQLNLVPIHTKLVCSFRGFDITKGATTKTIDWNGLATNFDAFFPVCSYFKQRLHEQTRKESIFVIGSPINTTAISHIKRIKNSSSYTLLVSVGRLVDKKGFLTALKACLILKDNNIQFRYSIVGSGKLKPAIDAFIEEHNLSSFIELCGSLPPQKTLEKISSADIFIAPSETADDGDSEGIPNVLKEAMLLRVPSIGTIHSGIPELICDKQSGYLCREKNPAELAETIMFAIKDANNWEKITNNAAKHVMLEYSPESTTKALLTAYRSILDRSY